MQNWAWSTAQQSISEGLRLVDEGLAPIVGGDRNSARKRSQSSKTDTTSAEEVGQQLERLDRRLRALLCVFSSLLARLQEGKGTHSSEMVEEEQDEFDLDAADAASRAMRDGMMEEVTELTVTGEHHLLHKMEVRMKNNQFIFRFFWHSCACIRLVCVCVSLFPCACLTVSLLNRLSLCSRRIYISSSPLADKCICIVSVCLSVYMYVVCLRVSFCVLAPCSHPLSRSDLLLPCCLRS